jgi:hypothetical protein
MAISQRPFDPYRAGAKVYRAYRANRRPALQTTLPAVVEAAHRQPNFPSLATLEVYAATAQHLHRDNFTNWMGDGASNFSLGKRHP